MKYDLDWHEDALDDLENLPKDQAELVIKKVEETLTEDPWNLGKTLKAHLKGFFRYTIGKHRVIYVVREEKIMILVLRVAKRDKVYKVFNPSRYV